MPITVTCRTCSVRLTTPDAAAGKQLKCPKCGQPLLVPQFEVVDTLPLAELIESSEAAMDAEKRQVPRAVPVNEAKKPNLTTCKDCDSPVSKKAKTCPHCGVSCPAVETGLIRIKRRRQLQGRALTMKFFINGESIGELRDGEMLKVEVPAGEQTLVVSYFTPNLASVTGRWMKTIGALASGTDETTVRIRTDRAARLTVEFGVSGHVRFNR
jgi:hypothetical protein